MIPDHLLQSFGVALGVLIVSLFLAVFAAISLRTHEIQGTAHSVGRACQGHIRSVQSEECEELESEYSDDSGKIMGSMFQPFSEAVSQDHLFTCQFKSWFVPLPNPDFSEVWGLSWRAFVGGG